MSESTFEVKAIGVIRADQGQFRLEIAEPYRPALKEMGQFSYVHVYWWAHELDTPEGRRILQAELPYAEGVTAGMFACRSPARPNPIAVTVCFVTAVDEAQGTVDLAYIDAFDGTPLLDLKPYVPMADRVREVRVAPWLAGWPDWLEDVPAFLAEHDIDFGE